MNELLGSDEICKAAHPLILTSGHIQPRKFNVDRLFPLATCWVDYLLLDPLEFYTIRPRFFGKQFLYLPYYYFLAQFIYEKAAILGRARRYKVELLVKLLGLTRFPPEYGWQVMRAAKEVATIRLGEFKEHNERDPISFEELFIDTLRRMTWGKSSKTTRQKISIDKALDYLRTLVIEGVGFGSEFPELTANMYRNHYENVDIDAWNKRRSEGANFPEKPTSIKLEDLEHALLKEITIPLINFGPSVLKRLNLLSYFKAWRSKLDRPLSEFYEIYDRPLTEWFEMYQCLLK